MAQIKFLLLLIILLLLQLAIAPAKIWASSALETFSDSTFTNQSTNFKAGQTIYVMVQADNDGSDKSILNLRDSNYDLLQSFTLTKASGNLYQATFTAPQNENYYSLEAQIVSGSSSATKVKTIKVGSPSEASVKVDVKNQVSGQSVKVQNNSTVAQSPPKADSSEASKAQSSDLTGASDVEFEPIQIDEEEQKETIILKATRFFKKIFTFIWIF